VTAGTAQGQQSRRAIRVLLCKPGLDGHDRGVKIVARALRDAGMEVVYLGMRLTARQIAQAAVQEDVDVIGVSNHSAALPELCEEILERLRENDGGEIPIVAGGTILEEDEIRLRELGVVAVFGPGTHTDRIVDSIRVLMAGRLEVGR
jgi:methylmalonyl-CoA mutase C-terminal domain/subunit